MLSVSYISREKMAYVFFYYTCVLKMCANDRVHYGPMIVFVCLHITLPDYHHNADVSECIGFLKYFSGTFCPVYLKIFSEKFAN